MNLLIDSMDRILYSLENMFCSGSLWANGLKSHGRTLQGGSPRLQELKHSKFNRAQNSELFRGGYLCTGKQLHFSHIQWRNNGACFLSH